MDTMTTTERLFDIDPDKARALAQSLHRKKEDFQVVRKSFAADKVENIESERAVVSYITTKSIDRDGEVLLPEGMVGSVYDKSGRPVFWGHQYGDPDFVIGQNLWYKADPSGNGIIAKTVFRNTEFADKVRRLYTEDQNGIGPVLKGWSVGFIPLEWEDGNTKGGGPRRTYTKWELLEYSTAPLQSNRDALTIACQKGIITSEIMKKDMGVPDAAPIVEPEVTPDVTDGSQNEEIRVTFDKGEPASGHPIIAVEDAFVELNTDVPAEVPEAKAIETPAEFEPGKMTIEVHLSDEWRDRLDSLRTDIESLKAGFPVRALPEPDTLETPCTFSDLKAAVSEIVGKISDIKATVEALRSERAPNTGGDTVKIESTASQTADLPVPPSTPATPEPDAATIVRDVMQSLNLKAILNESVKEELAKLRGRVE